MANSAHTTRNTKRVNASTKKTPKTKSMSEAHLSNEVELPKAVYFRYRYRLALKAKNLGKAEYYKNRLTAMEEPCLVKDEKFTTLAQAKAWLESKAAKAAPVKESKKAPKTESSPVVENKTAKPSNLSKLEEFAKLVAIIKSAGLSEADTATIVSKAAMQLLA